MSLIRMENVTKKYEDTLIFRDIYFRVSKGERIGLIGRNGAGKSTVFKLILGKEEATSGKVEVDPKVKVSYFSQFSELHGGLSIQQELELCFEQVALIEQELKEIGKKLAQVTNEKEMDGLLNRQNELFEQMEHLDGWNVAVEINTVLTKLGFDERTRNQPVDELSGGWRNRAALAKILIELPDVVLLDEPTNFLDIEGLEWLEHWLRRFNGAMILVSHDRQFIDKVVTRTIEIEKARVALAKCLLSGAAVIILDEPTNHLDLQSIQVMEQALIHFPGAVVTVSHDRFFIDKIATKLLHFDPISGINEQNL